MKIEKMSENQVKIVLNKEDLNERNIKLSELAYGSEKVQSLFREMMEQAVVEYGFQSDNTPLMVEAFPIALDSIMILVTKVSSSDELEGKLSLLPQTRDGRKFKKKGLLEEKSENVEDDKICIYSFHSLDDVASLSSRLYKLFTGTNLLFKEQSKYFLVLHTDEGLETLTLQELESILSEYGQKHTSSYLSKFYLYEHGELLIKDSAITILAEHL